MSNPNIAKLTPAAARLLLAFLAAGPGESYDDAVQRSGIQGCLTLMTAKKQLKSLGFVSEGPDGREDILFFPDDQMTEEQKSRTNDGAFVSVVRKALRVTDAKGM